MRDIKTIFNASGVGITDFGSNIPWAPVLLVLETFQFYIIGSIHSKKTRFPLGLNFTFFFL